MKIIFPFLLEATNIAESRINLDTGISRSSPLHARIYGYEEKQP